MATARIVTMFTLLALVVLSAGLLGAEPVTGNKTPANNTTTQWAHTYGNSNIEAVAGLDADATSIAIAGTTERPTSSVHAESDSNLWLLTLHGNGTERWNRSYGYAYDDAGGDVALHPDGGYLLVGTISGAGGDTSAGWAVRIAANGTTLWNRTYPRTGNRSVFTGDTNLRSEDELFHRAYSVTDIIPAHGEGYLLFGNSGPTFQGTFSTWAVRIGPNGTQRWSFYADKASRGYGIERVEDGYVIVGMVGGGETRIPTPPRPHTAYPWMLKLNRDGTVVWQRTYENASDAYVADVAHLQTGGYMLVANYGGDTRIIRTGPQGRSQWTRPYTETELSTITAIEQGAVLTGYRWQVVRMTETGRVGRLRTIKPDWTVRTPSGVAMRPDGLIVAGKVEGVAGVAQLSSDMYQATPTVTTATTTLRTPSAATTRDQSVEHQSPTRTTRTTQPGFGISVVVVVVLGLLVLLRQRRISLRTTDGKK